MSERNFDIAAARSGIYGFLARALADPSPALLGDVLDQVPDAQACLDLLDASACAGMLGRFHASLRQMTPEGLCQSHLDCFGHAVSKECPPYEAEYGQSHVFQKADCLADIAGFYRAFGLEPSAELHDRHDHVSVELEFMEFLCAKEAYALARSHDADAVEMCRHGQRRFLDEHLGAWVFGFADRLTAKADGSPLGFAARLLAGCVADDLRRLGLNADRPSVAPQEEPPGAATMACASCLSESDSPDSNRS